MRPIVGAVHDNGVVGDTQLVDFVEHGADIFVMVDHRIVIRALPASGLTQALGFGMGAKVHVSKIDPDEHRFSGLGLFFDKFGGTGGDIIIDSLHALLGQRAGVLDLAVGKAVEDPTRPEFLAEFGVLRIIGKFRLFLGIQMIEVAVELVETVGSGQKFILVAQVIFAELSGRIALGFQQLGDSRIFLLSPRSAPGIPTLLKPVRNTLWPVIKAERPAVQLCSA